MKMAVLFVFPDTVYSRCGFQQSESKEDVAEGYEPPDVPLEDYPQHKDDASGKDYPVCQRVLLEEHQGGK